MPTQVRIIVDERERASGVPELLEGLGIRVDYCMLSVGDYIISPECAIERKDAHDFVNSLFSGRLFDQAHRMSEAYKIPVLIVEGDIQAMVLELEKPRSIWGALATVSFGYGLHTFFTHDTHQTADLIFTMARRGRFVHPRGPIVRRKPRGETVQEVQLNVVSALPGVGTRLADRILRQFGSVRRVFGASIAELSLVNGFGRGKAEKIAKVLDTPYASVSRSLAQRRLDEEAKP